MGRHGAAPNGRGPTALGIELGAKARRVAPLTQVHERIVSDSLEELVAPFDWSSHTTYDLDAPGRNHGLVLGTLGWRP